MREIVLLDTSVYLNMLDVPGRNQHRDEVFEEFERRIEAGHHFLLPLVTVLETGNHIARLRDGRHRYDYARRLVEDVRRALKGETPYHPTYFPEREQFRQWLEAFPQYAKGGTGPEVGRAGLSLIDACIIGEMERLRRLHGEYRVGIWSLDDHLRGY